MANLIKIDGRIMTEDEIKLIIFDCYEITDDLDDDDNDFPTTGFSMHSENMRHNLSYMNCIDNEEDVPESITSVSTVIDSVSFSFSEQPTSNPELSCSFPYQFRNVVIDPASATMEKEDVKFRGNSRFQ